MERAGPRTLAIALLASLAMAAIGATLATRRKTACLPTKPAHLRLVHQRDARASMLIYGVGQADIVVDDGHTRCVYDGPWVEQDVGAGRLFAGIEIVRAVVRSENGTERVEHPRQAVRLLIEKAQDPTTAFTTSATACPTGEAWAPLRDLLATDATWVPADVHLAD